MKKTAKKIEKTGKKNVKIREDLHKQIDAYTTKEGGKIEGFVNRAIEMRLASINVTAKTSSKGL